MLHGAHELRRIIREMLPPFAAKGGFSLLYIVPDHLDMSNAGPRRSTWSISIPLSSGYARKERVGSLELMKSDINQVHAKDPNRPTAEEGWKDRSY